MRTPARLGSVHTVDNRDQKDQEDQVVQIADLPQMDTGAPHPIVFATERGVTLSYLLLDRVNWDDPESVFRDRGPTLAVVTFVRPIFHSFGSPNDEALSGHPLAKRGLRSYGAFRVEHSSLIRQLAQMNSVHPQHDASRYENLSHYIWTFHDSTFECVAQSFEVVLKKADEREQVAAMLEAWRIYRGESRADNS